MMNNILVDKDIFKIIDNDTFFDITNDSNLTLYITNKNVCLSFKVNKNISSCVNIFNVDSDIKINIDVLDNGNINFVNSVINNKDLDIVLDINHSKDSTSDIVNHGLNINDGNMKFIINGIVKKGMTNTVLKQDNKIINLNDGVSLIEPNLLIDEFDTNANHSAYISKYSKEEIFYLQSRGISEKEGFRLLTKSFLLGKMTLEDEIKSMFTEEIYKI